MRQCQNTDCGEPSTVVWTTGSAVPFRIDRASELSSPLYNDAFNGSSSPSVAASTSPSVSVTFHQGLIANWILSR